MVAGEIELNEQSPSEEELKDNIAEERKTILQRLCFVVHLFRFVVVVVVVYEKEIKGVKSSLEMKQHVVVDVECCERWRPIDATRDSCCVDREQLLLTMMMHL